MCCIFVTLLILLTTRTLSLWHVARFNTIYHKILVCRNCLVLYRDSVTLSPYLNSLRMLLPVARPTALLPIRWPTLPFFTALTSPMIRASL